jgi:hypothetical protein
VAALIGLATMKQESHTLAGQVIALPPFYFILELLMKVEKPFFPMPKVL